MGSRPGDPLRFLHRGVGPARSAWVPHSEKRGWSNLRICMFFRSVLLAVLAAASALRIPIVVSRRAAVAGATAAAVGLAPANAALKPCPSGANNCWSSASTDKTKLSTWTWPSSTSRTAAMADLRAQVLMNPERHACDPALAMPFTPGSVRCAPLRRRCVAGVPAGGPGRRGSRRLDIGRRHAELPAC